MPPLWDSPWGPGPLPPDPTRPPCLCQSPASLLCERLSLHYAFSPRRPKPSPPTAPSPPGPGFRGFNATVGSCRDTSRVELRTHQILELLSSPRVSRKGVFFGGSVCADVINWNEVIREDPNPTRLVSSQEEDIWGQTHGARRRAGAGRGHTHTPRREAGPRSPSPSQKSRAADSLVSDLPPRDRETTRFRCPSPSGRDASSSSPNRQVQGVLVQRTSGQRQPSGSRPQPASPGHGVQKPERGARTAATLFGAGCHQRYLTDAPASQNIIRGRHRAAFCERELRRR